MTSKTVVVHYCRIRSFGSDVDLYCLCEGNLFSVICFQLLIDMNSTLQQLKVLCFSAFDAIYRLLGTLISTLKIFIVVRYMQLQMLTI